MTKKERKHNDMVNGAIEFSKFRKNLTQKSQKQKSRIDAKIANGRGNTERLKKRSAYLGFVLGEPDNEVWF